MLPTLWECVKQFIGLATGGGIECDPRGLRRRDVDVLGVNGTVAV